MEESLLIIALKDLFSTFSNDKSLWNSIKKVRIQCLFTHSFYLCWSIVSPHIFIWRQMSKVQLMHWKVESSKNSLTSNDFFIPISVYPTFIIPHSTRHTRFTWKMFSLDVKAMNEKYKHTQYGGLATLRSGNKRRKNMHWKIL